MFTVNCWFKEKKLMVMARFVECWQFRYITINLGLHALRIELQSVIFVTLELFELD